MQNINKTINLHPLKNPKYMYTQNSAYNLIGFVVDTWTRLLTFALTLSGVQRLESLIFFFFWQTHLKLFNFSFIIALSKIYDPSSLPVATLRPWSQS